MARPPARHRLSCRKSGERRGVAAATKCGMSDFKSDTDRDQFVAVLRLINPITATAYGPLLDSWAWLDALVPAVASRANLVAILKTIDPVTLDVYGLALDHWAEAPFDRHALVAILKTINPVTVVAYGPMLDAWAGP